MSDHARPSFSPILALTFSSSLLVAQAEPAPSRSGEPRNARPAAGRQAGTERWNVTFRERGFDLAGFRGAIESGADAGAVAAVVRDLERRAREEQEPFRTAVERLGGRVTQHFWLINACSIEIGPDHVPAIRALPNVLLVDPDLEAAPIGAPPLPIKRATDYYHHNADAEQANGNRATGVGIAIVDTSQNDQANGTARPHMLYYRNANKNDHGAGGIDGSRLIANYQMGAQAADYPHVHGTAVASIAAGAGWSNSLADAGHASDAAVVGYSICDYAPNCTSLFSTQAAAWQKVAADKVAHRISVANMSYSSSPNPLDVSQQALDACVLNADVLIVTGAANDGNLTSNSSSTANGLAVAACDNNKVIAGFSSKGPIAGDGARYYPDITGNGVDTVMAMFGNEISNFVASGTSMASPQVAGAAGLVKSARPAASARELKAILLCATESIASMNPGGSRNWYGMGYLRDDLSCTVARNAAGVVSGTITSTAAPKTHSLAVVATQEVSVALAWHRQVMTSTAWSDLNLRVLNGTTVVASSASPRNLYEKVTFIAPITGNLTVEVAAASLEVGSLPYSLATTASFAGTVTPGSYVTFGTGCSGSGGSAQPGCPAVNDNGTLGDWQGTIRYAVLANTGAAARTITGVQLFCKQRPGGGSSYTCWIYDRTPGGGPPRNALASGTVTLGQAAAWYSASFPAVALPAQTDFFIVIKDSGNSYLPIATSGQLVTCYNEYPTWMGPYQANYWNYRVVCGGNAAVPWLTSVGTPRIGTTFTVSLSQARPYAAAFLALGSSDRTWLGLALPLDLQRYGAPTCSLYCSHDRVDALVTNAVGTASFGYPVPNDASLVGRSFFNQYLVQDPQANPLGLVTTQGGKGLIGNQ